MRYLIIVFFLGSSALIGCSTSNKSNTDQCTSKEQGNCPKIMRPSHVEHEHGGGKN